MSTATAPVAVSIPLPVGRLVGVGAIIFCANAALLVLQLVAGRLLAPFVGSSLETWTSIIGVFLSGIALGNGFGGKLADRYPTPRTLAALLVLGAIAALWMMFFPMLLTATGLHKPIPLGVRIPILAVVLCLPAGFVLSLLTPLAIKLGLPDVGHTGRVAGLIFALSTLGCLIGNYLTGFYLIPTFTINTLVLVSVGALLVLAGVSLVVVKPVEVSGSEDPSPRPPPPGGEGESAFGGTAPSRVGVTESSSEGLPPPLPLGEGVGGRGSSSAEANPHAFTDIRQAYLIVFLASFCGMTLELTASRVLAQQLGVSLFTWTGIIGVMLAGTALGNFTGGQLADRPLRTIAWLTAIATGLLVLATGFGIAHLMELPVPWLLGGAARGGVPDIRPSDELLRQLRIVLLVTIAVGGLAGVMVYRIRRLVPERSVLTPRFVLAATLCWAAGATVFLFVAMALVSRWTLFTSWGPITQVIAWTFSLFFLPMFMLGLVSPQVIRLSVPDVAHAGRVAGRVYAWSTVGAIVGTFAAGYFLLSTFGMQRTILGASLILVLSSLLAAKVWDNNPLLYVFSIVLGGVTGGFILTASKGLDEETVVQVESNYYTIKVGHYPMQGRETALSLNLDRLLHSVVDPEDPKYFFYEHEYIQVELMWLARAKLQAAGKPPTPRALVVGGGGYTFPRYVMEVMPEAHVDVVEIDPKVTQVAYDYLGLKKYPNMHPIHMDGRQFVAERAAPGSYDLVIQDAVNDLSVPAHLMTKEYNDAIKVALKPDGAYLLTIIDSVGGGKLWKAAMATLALTFPPENVVLLTPEAVSESGTPSGDSWDKTRRVMVIYASDKPFDPAVLAAALPDAVARAALWSVARPVAMLSAPVGGPGMALLHLGLADHVEIDRPSAARTVLVPSARLKLFTDREPGVILTDQFCPVDNLMAEVFRNK